MALLATAGHVDHGKSTLVEALTGTDPDRLPEEKRRGLTIDLGFAHGRLPSGAEISFVDVPGHERFLSNMLAGVGAVDACLFVVDAREGWKPQSEEHLRILDLLGVGAGVVALSHAAGVGATVLEQRRTELASRLAGTFLAAAAVVAVDAPAGVGLAELGAALDGVAARSPLATDRNRPRLWIDRAFTVTGSGTVVTGTLTGGSIEVGAELVAEPGGRPIRVRSLQIHNRTTPRAVPGHRVAVGLVGGTPAALRRGVALVRAGQWHRTDRLDVRLEALATLTHPVGRRGGYLAYVGSGAWAAEVRLIDTEAVEPGTDGLARLHLPEPLPLVPGDRFVLRDSGRGETVGGGTVLDVDPRGPVARARPAGTPAAVVAARGWVAVDELERLTGTRVTPTVAGWVVSPVALAAEQTELRDRLAAAGPAGIELAALSERARAAMTTLDGVRTTHGRAVAAAASEQPSAVLARLDARPFAPDQPRDAERAELSLLARQGSVVGRDGLWFTAAALDQAAEVVGDLLATRPEGVTLSEFRQALGTTRRFALALAELLDERGVTRRVGPRRVAGPRTRR